MRVVLAPDSFKESMTAAEAAAAMARGVRQVYPDAQCIAKPLADGGEGTLAVLSAALAADLISVDTQDALGRPMQAPLGLTGSGTAIIEAATVIGLAQLPAAERRIERASSMGLAALIRAALDAGSTRIIIGLGGTATCDGGAGLLAGLGAQLRDASGRSLPPNPVGLARLAEVDLRALDARLSACEIVAASDVTNPLLGADGAATVFAPQKGADAQQVRWLEAGLTRWADVLAAAGAGDLRDRPGAGAAGGLGAALLALGAVLRSGSELIAEAIGLDAAIDGADLVLTGEGSLDGQTAAGKAPLGVLRIAAGRGVPVWAFGGRVRDRDRLDELGFAELISLSDDSDAPPTAAELALGAQRLEHVVSMILARRRDRAD
ncbi:MAG TPA: glycerate kinase [Propionicimonas sp.]|nr:glycerate kinase [Propionicimonas sp.]